MDHPRTAEPAQPASSAATATPRIARLGSWPTPLEPAPRLAERIGLRPGDLWIKRDDLTGLAGGGNKVRKLEHTAGAALAAGADTLVTTGAAQSNHARSTAAAAARLGLRCLLVLAGEPPPVPVGNLVLDHLLGAELHWAGPADDAALEARAAELVDALRAGGRSPYLVPFGGSGPIGSRGYLDCARELTEQAPDLAHAVVSVGSGGTTAGLVAGLGADRVLGVDSGAVADPAWRVREMVTALGGSPDGLRLRGDQVGEGYGKLTAAARQAMSDLARAEGLALDPVYTAKAFAGLTAAVRDGEIRPGQRTVFLHTGGLPGLFGHSYAAELGSDG
jgi:1-aminocyclopropane-1-carboxylate deaminase/D-cysteine desulfhydrase-like pyridoxal-dependent ACC family enzyme